MGVFVNAVVSVLVAVLLVVVVKLQLLLLLPRLSESTMLSNMSAQDVYMQRKL